MEQTRVSTPQGGHSAPAAHTARSKAPAHAGAQAAPDEAGGGAGGFLSLLSALGSGMEPPLVAAEGAAPPPALDPGALVALLGAQVPGGAAGTPGQGNVPSILTPGVSTLSLAGAGMPGGAGALGGVATALGADALPSGGLVAQTGAPALGGVATALGADALPSGGMMAQTGAPALGGVATALGVDALPSGSLMAQMGTPALGGVAAALGVDALPSGGLVAQTALLDKALDTPVQEGANTLAGYRRAFSRMQGALSPSLAGTSTTALAASHRLGAGDKSLAPAWLAAAPGMQALPERRDAAVMAAAVPRALPEAAVAVALAPASAPEMPTLARTSEGGTALGAVAEAWGSASYGPEGAPLTEVGSAVAEPGQTGAEDALAEQVAYWVSENLQNAELTVTHDGKPVEVSVSMSGKEAHIVFGSDQSETRDLLDASVAQLRDLLHSEGLVLSGVTVGGSGARNAAAEGGDTPRGRQGARQAQVPVAETGAVRPAILTDRAVDVFV